jgi:hypothetical protein
MCHDVNKLSTHFVTKSQIVPDLVMCGEFKNGLYTMKPLKEELNLLLSA